MNGYKTITFEIEDDVATLTLARPETRNALDYVMRNELAGVIHDIERNRSLKALIITGAGTDFCSGGDINVMKAGARPPLEVQQRVSDLHTWFQPLLNLPLPVIAAVDGAAFGAGFNLALASDFILASERARFCAVFGRIGMVPDLGGMFLLPRIVGLQVAKDIVFTSRIVPAAEAKQLGIVHRIVAQDRLLPVARTLASRFRLASTEAIGMAKRALNQSFNLDAQSLAQIEASLVAVCMSTEYHKRAVEQFLRNEPLAFDWERLDRETEIREGPPTP